MATICIVCLSKYASGTLVKWTNAFCINDAVSLDVLISPTCLFNVKVMLTAASQRSYFAAPFVVIVIFILMLFLVTMFYWNNCMH